MEEERQRAFFERLREETLIRKDWVDRAQARLEQLAEHFLGDLSRLRGDVKELERDLTAELRAEQRTLLAEVEDRIHAAASEALSLLVSRGEARLRAVGRQAERDARNTTAEAAKTARFRIDLANRALEREMRIRSATERMEREMASRVRAAEQRLLDVLDRVAQAETRPQAPGGPGLSEEAPA